MKRIGLGKGKGKGYKNLIPKDKKVHHDSGRGIKQPQRIINLHRVAYGNPKTPIQLREYQMGVGMPVGTIKEFENLFENKNVRLDIPLNIKEKIEVTKKLKLKDSDKDGVADILDCEPNNINKQGSFSASTILQQLGGNKFIAMTGAKHFFKDDKKQLIGFKIGRNASNINYVKIKLNVMDTYDMQFINIRAGKLTIKSEVKGVYNDQLEEIFTRETGLYTRL